MKGKRLVDLSMYLPLILLLCVSLLVGCSSSSNYKNEIFQLIEEQNATIMEDIAHNEFSSSLSFEEIESVAVLEQCVNFYCGGYGIATSSHEFGFYYSFDDQPLGFWEDVVFASGVELTKEGNGFIGKFQHNSYYTEKICDYFWYYELHF